MADRYLEEAVRQYEQGIESNEPFYMDASTLLDIQAYYARDNRHYDAERCLRFALRLHPDDEEVLVAKAYQLKNQGRWSEGLAIVNAVTDKGNREVQLFYIEMSIAAGQLDEAEDALQANLDAAERGELCDWYVDFAEILLDYGYAARSLKWLRKVRNAPCTYRDAKHFFELLADAEHLAGDDKGSVEAANRLIDADTYDAVSWCQLAEVQQTAGDYEESIKSCDYALAVSPGHRQAMSTKLFDLFALGRAEEAFGLCRQYMDEQPDDYTLPMYAGEQYSSLEAEGEERKRNLRQAETLLRRALSLCQIENADRTRIFSALSHTLCMLGRADEAEEQMLAAVSSGISRYEAHVQLAAWLGGAGDTAGVLRQLRKAFSCRAASGDPDGFSVAQTLVAQGLFQEAEDLWRTFPLPPAVFSRKELNALLALAMYHLGESRLHSLFMAISVRECPYYLAELFHNELPGVPMGDFPTHMVSEMLKMQSEARKADERNGRDEGREKEDGASGTPGDR